MTGWPANPKLVRHLKSTLIRMCVHVDEAVMGLSVRTDGDGEGENPLLLWSYMYYVLLLATTMATNTNYSTGRTYSCIY